MGRKKKASQLNIDGVFLLNKPLGLSSNQALQKVRRAYNAAKAGHTGSLDPLASGLLPICFGEATKFSQYLLAADKRYDFTIRLGQVTTTGDAEGEVVSEKDFSHITQDQIAAALQRFTGDIEQVPPMYSALKHKGQPLYKLARQGVEVERPPRAVTIYELTLISASLPELECSVHSSKGTYVRSLAVDIGEALGCGAHVSKLHRTAVGDITSDRMIPLSALEESCVDSDRREMDAWILPIQDFLRDMPKHAVFPSTARLLRSGQKISVPPGLPLNEPVCLFDLSGTFLGLGECDGAYLLPKKLCQTAKS